MNNLKEFKIFVDKILENNSRTYKLNLLQQYKDNKTIKYFLQCIYDPYIIFGLNLKKLNKKIKSKSEVIISSSIDCLEYLKVNNTGRDIDIAAINTFRDTLDPDLKPLFDRIVSKDVQLGVRCQVY